MRALVVVGAALLALTGCSDGSGSQAAPAPTVAPTATHDATSSPAPSVTLPAEGQLTVTRVASQPVSSTAQGIALYAHHAAYVEDERRLVVMDWRTGRTRVVARARYGSLFLLRVSGRFAYVVDRRPPPSGDDPASPRRAFALDLVSGRTAPARLPEDGELLGSFNDVEYDVVHPRHDGVTGWRGDIHGVWQEPGPHVPDQRLTQSGRVYEASYDGDHRLVWTERVDPAHSNPTSVWTMDLFQPQQAPVLLATRPGSAISAPVVGAGFAGWVEDDAHLVLTPLTGGDPMQLPGHLKPATAPAADRNLVAVVVDHAGRSDLVVLRVG